MSLLITSICILVHLCSSLFQVLDDIVINAGNGLARLVVVSCLLLWLDRTIAVGPHNEEIGKGLHELQFADGIVFHGSADVTHRLDMTLGIVTTTYHTIAAFPEGISDITLTLEVTCSKGAEEPVRTTDVVGIKLQHTWEVTPAEHIVDPLRVGTCEPLGCSLAGVTYSLIGDLALRIFLYPAVTCRQTDQTEEQKDIFHIFCRHHNLFLFIILNQKTKFIPKVKLRGLG